MCHDIVVLTIFATSSMSAEVGSFRCRRSLSGRASALPRVCHVAHTFFIVSEWQRSPVRHGLGFLHGCVERRRSLASACRVVERGTNGWLGGRG